ncbi:sugar ABC transporter substrate-binding protein, partial [Acidovorax cavernicola]
STAVDPAIRRIHAAGIPIVGLVTPVLAVPVACFVNSDDYTLALGIARQLFAYLGGAGDVLVVSGHSDSYTSLERLRGFGDAAAEYQGIVLLGTIAGDYVRDVALLRTQAWLEAHPDASLTACLVANDIMAVGVIEALRAYRREAVVVGVNAIPEAVQAIQRGEMLATADFNAMRMAHLATECAIRHVRAEAVPRHIELPVQIVDAHNAHLWDMPYAQRPIWTLAEALAQIARTGTGRVE